VKIGYCLVGANQKLRLLFVAKSGSREAKIVEEQIDGCTVCVVPGRTCMIWMARCQMYSGPLIRAD
jgi:hypothetical protein